MKNILIIGAGGIGSWLLSRLSRLAQYNQIKDVEITIYDSDVVEEKNLPYQNFEELDITDPKVYAVEPLSEMPLIRRFEKIETEDQLKSYDVIICAVDNSKTRELVFRFCNKNKQTYFIDLRAEGTAVWAITSDSGWSLEQLLNTLSKEEKSTSCQLDYELNNGIIQLGNIIIADIGAQLLLNYLRGKKNSHFTARF